MADLESLIKVRRHAVDEKRRFIAQLYREAEKFEQQKQVILNQMKKEEAMAEQMATAEAAAFLGRYLEGARKKIRALDSSIKKMETRIAAAQEDMRTAFAELKKVEITQRNRNKREKTVRDKRESKELDEIGVGRFHRREKEEK